MKGRGWPQRCADCEAAARIAERMNQWPQPVYPAVVVVRGVPVCEQHRRAR